MGSGDLTTAPVVAVYLSALDSALPLSRRQRTRIVDEVADGLECEIEAGIAAGKAPQVVTREALAGLGTPAMLAARFTAAIAPGLAWRTGMGLVLSGPLVGLAWVTASGRGQGWQDRISSVFSAVPGLPILLAATVACAGVAVLAGRRGRWASSAALLATLGCMTVDAVLLGAAVHRFTPAAWALPAVTLSVVRLAGAASACHRLMCFRAAGN